MSTLLIYFFYIQSLRLHVKSFHFDFGYVFMI
nr:MAG TPA: hypothetical protein [Caudoviricetes sp.]